MKKTYIGSSLMRRTARPRSPRLLAEQGAVVAGQGIVQSDQAGTDTPVLPSDAHTHANLADLDKISVDGKYIQVDVTTEETDPETGEMHTVTSPERASAGHADEASLADEAKDLTEDSPVRQDFLSSKEDDVAEGSIGFKKGLQSGDFQPGFTGSGAQILPDGAAEFRSLAVRKFVEVPEFRYNRVDIRVGNFWRAPGGGVVESVTDNGDGTGAIRLHLTDGEIGAVKKDDICMGVFHDFSEDAENETENGDDGKGNFRFAGFTSVYFRITEVTETVHNSEFTYSLRPASSSWTSRRPPMASMTFVAYGSFTDKARQSSRYSTLTYERYLKDVDDWEIGQDNLAAQFGDLSNLSVYGMNMTGYSSYVDNAYFRGLLSSLDGSVALDAVNRTFRLGTGLSYSPDGGLVIDGSVLVRGDGSRVTLPSFRGPFSSAETYVRGDIVTYLGTTYICTAETSTGILPTDTGHWALMAQKGEDAGQELNIVVTAGAGTTLLEKDSPVIFAAHVYRGGEDVTDEYADRLSWVRVSNDGESDDWDGTVHTGRTLTVSYADISGNDYFCADLGQDVEGSLTSMQAGGTLLKTGDSLISMKL